MSEQSFVLLSPEKIEGIGPTRSSAQRDRGITTIARCSVWVRDEFMSFCTTAGARQVGEWCWRCYGPTRFATD